MTTILADGINLGLTKMAESCPGTSKSSLEGTQAWYIRDETYSAALAELVNALSRISSIENQNIYRLHLLYPEYCLN